MGEATARYDQEGSGQPEVLTIVRDGTEPVRNGGLTESLFLKVNPKSSEKYQKKSRCVMVA